MSEHTPAHTHTRHTDTDTDTDTHTHTHTHTQICKYRHCVHCTFKIITNTHKKCIYALCPANI